MNAEAAPMAAARKRKTQWAIGVVVALGLIVAAVAGFTLLRPKTSSQASFSTATATKQTIKVVVSGSGTAVVSDSVTVNPKISGTVKKLYVSLGETVTAGQELYTITSDDVETQLLQAKASLLQSKQNLSQSQSSLTQANNALYNANTTKIQAQQTLDDLESQPATAGLADKITIAKRNLTSAKKGVTSAKQGVTSAEVGVSAAKANYTSSQQSYNDAKDATGDTVVTAPIDGVITALPISVGSAVTAGTTSSSSSNSSSASSASSGASTGSSSGSSSSSITISDMGSLDVEVSVSEADITSVAVEQTATITFDAIKDKEFVGTVKSISPNGTSSSGVVNYTVTLTLAEQDERLKPDMTATADIATVVAENVLTVPTTAVKSNNGEKYVVVVQNGQTANTPVTVGVSDDTNTQITSGISEGAVVVTGSTTSSSSSSSSSSSRGSAGGAFMMGGGGPPSGGPGGN